MDFYRENLTAIGEEIIYSGVDKFRNDLQEYPISGFLKTQNRLILIEVETKKKIHDDETQRIIREKFHPLSQRKDIVGIIESLKGWLSVATYLLSIIRYLIKLSPRSPFNDISF